MFFFFVGGIRQKVSQILQPDVARCLRCGSQASFANYDNVLELFFIPVWRWPGKNPALYCENCGFLMPAEHFEPHRDKARRVEGAETPGIITPDQLLRCWSCSRVLESGFKYCPDCGSRQEF